MQTTQLHLSVTVTITGDLSPADRTDILQRIDDGALDLSLLALLRAEFGQRGDSWRFSLASTGASMAVTP